MAGYGRFSWLLLLVPALGACQEVGPPEFEASQFLGGEQVPAAVLNKGRRSYRTYCRPCHGPFGDGSGPLGHQQDPRARDLRLGIIKFGSVPSGSLPTHQDLKRVVKEGIPGTAMLPWPVPEDELDAVVHFIKTFSDRWKTQEPAAPVPETRDPWVGAITEAIAAGDDLYHGRAGCLSCHPAYREATRLGPEPRPRAHEPTTTDSAYGPIRATDLRRDVLRNGEDPRSLYRVIAAGVGGTAMPTWHGVLSPREIWSLVHFVGSLRPAPDTPGPPRP